MAAQEPEIKLGEFILKLVISSDLRTAFETNQQETLANSGLNEDKQAILASGDLRRILDELASEYGIRPGDHFA